MGERKNFLIRDVCGNRVLAAFPTRFVADDGETIATRLPPGTHCVYPDSFDEEGRVKPLERWGTRPHLWFGNGILRLKRRGAAHSIVLFRHDDCAFAGWYVNLDEPLRETARGYDTRDHALDLWIEPDGTVTWKDEDHLEQAAALGILDPAAVRAEAERVLAAWPFPTGWEDWRPDPAWPTPALPEGWDVA